jgi:hypothetical protein
VECDTTTKIFSFDYLTIPILTPHATLRAHRNPNNTDPDS